MNGGPAVYGRAGRKNRIARGSDLKKKVLYRIQDYVFLLPTMLLIVVFVLYPFITGVIYSFSDWNGMIVTRWVGFENYIRLFQDTNFRAAIQNTLMYGIVVTLIILPLGMLFACVLNARTLRMRGVLRTAIYLPVTISLLVVANVFNVILAFDGIVDQIWMMLGNEKGLNLMSSITGMRVAMICIMIWHGMGSCVVFLLAGLQGIPQELHEAAMVDGANAVTSFFRITLPLMRPTIMIVTFITMNNLLKTFDLPFKLSQGGPGTATISVAMLIYKQAFTFNTAGYATTTGIILLIVVSILAVLQMRVTGGKEDAT